LGVQRRRARCLPILVAITLVTLGCNLGSPTITRTRTAPPTLQPTSSSLPTDLPSPIPTINTASLTPAQVPPPTNQSPSSPSQPDIQRIRFQRGAISATVSGQIALGGTDQWVAEARMAQTFSIQLNVSTGTAYLTITGEDGAVLLGDIERATNYIGVLPTSQDYFINIINSSQTSTSYTLTLTIK